MKMKGIGVDEYMGHQHPASLHICIMPPQLSLKPDDRRAPGLLLMQTPES